MHGFYFRFHGFTLYIGIWIRYNNIADFGFIISIDQYITVMDHVETTFLWLSMCSPKITLLMCFLNWFTLSHKMWSNLFTTFNHIKWHIFRLVSYVFCDSGTIISSIRSHYFFLEEIIPLRRLWIKRQIHCTQPHSRNDILSFLWISHKIYILDFKVSFFKVNFLT